MHTESNNIKRRPLRPPKRDYWDCVVFPSRDSNPGPDTSLGCHSIQLSYLVGAKVRFFFDIGNFLLSMGR